MPSEGFPCSNSCLPVPYDPLDFIGGHWNWTGKLFELMAALLFALVLIATRRFSRQDFGLTLVQRPGTMRAVCRQLRRRLDSGTVRQPCGAGAGA